VAERDRRLRLRHLADPGAPLPPSITLPFNLDPYRIVLAALILALLAAVFSGRARFEFLGFGAPLAILAGTATLSAILNYESLSGVPGEGAFKLLSYYLGFLLVFVLVASTIKTQAAMDTAVRALVVGATIGPPRPSTSRAPATTHSITWPSGSPRSSASLVRSSSCAAAASVPMPPRSTRSLSRPPSSWRSRSPST
jgi:hypothetical protein